jgi:hypothetical protein
MAASETPWSISAEKTVTAAETAEALVSATQKVYSVTIIAKAANTGQVYIGGSDVASTTNDGLDSGDSITFSVDPRSPAMDLADFFIDVDTSGEGVDFYAVKA